MLKHIVTQLKIYKNVYMRHTKIILFLSTVIWMFSCQVYSIRGADNPGANSADGVNSEKAIRQNERYNLASDREQLEKLRQDIPEDVRIKNDEQALYQDWMNGYTKSPSDIRTKFSQLLMRKRNTFNSDMSKVRQDFNKDEKKQRDIFFKELDEERSAIKFLKTTPARQKDLYLEVENKRKEFLSQLKDKRDSFEIDYRQKRKDFDDYIKERTDDFNAQMKDYTDKYNEYQKQKNKL